MKSTLVMIAVITVAATQARAQALTLKGETQLSEWNTTQAGQVLLKQSSVKAAAKLSPKGALALKFNGYGQAEICDLKGDSPNGEPELAPCLKSHVEYAPQFDIEMPLEVTTLVEDVKSTQTVTLKASVNECIENFDSFKTTTKPTQAPARALMKPCDFFIASEQIQFGGKSKSLANADTKVTLQVLLAGKLAAAGAIDNGQPEAKVAQAVADAAKTLTSAGLGSELELTAQVKARDGKPVDLFTYSLEIQLK